jgi:hypothetical protein
MKLALCILVIVALCGCRWPGVDNHGPQPPWDRATATNSPAK